MPAPSAHLRLISSAPEPRRSFRKTAARRRPRARRHRGFKRIITTSGAATIQNQSFTFDALGNLSARFDSVAGFTETFSYDNLNRLTTATQGAATTTVTYDSIGNITNKSNVGTYTYGAKPHAVTQVTGTLNASYTYDNNGNLTSGAGRTVTLTSYNLRRASTSSTTPTTPASCKPRQHKPRSTSTRALMPASTLKKKSKAALPNTSTTSTVRAG